MSPQERGAHTPGPWSIRVDPSFGIDVEAPAGRGLFYVIASNVGGRTKKDSSGKWTDRSEHKANAHLIAAAPELLEACQQARSMTPDGGHTASVLDAAIAKATGTQP